MAANQVILYFEKPQDALLITLAASSLMTEEGSLHSSKAAVSLRRKFAKPVESRLREHSTLREGAAKLNDSKSCAANRSPRPHVPRRVHVSSRTVAASRRFEKTQSDA